MPIWELITKQNDKISPKTYYVLIAAEQFWKIKLNGQTIISNKGNYSINDASPTAGICATIGSGFIPVPCVYISYNISFLCYLDYEKLYS